MSSSKSKSAPPPPTYEDGVECTPEGLFKGLAGCFGFLLSLVVVASLGVIAGGIFWTAQNMDRITNTDSQATKDVFLNIRPATLTSALEKGLKFVDDGNNGVKITLTSS